MKLKQNSTFRESECVGFLFISPDVGYPITINPEIVNKGLWTNNNDLYL